MALNADSQPSSSGCLAAGCSFEGACGFTGRRDLAGDVNDTGVPVPLAPEVFGMMLCGAVDCSAIIEFVVRRSPLSVRFTDTSGSGADVASREPTNERSGPDTNGVRTSAVIMLPST